MWTSFLSWVASGGAWRQVQIARGCLWEYGETWFLGGLAAGLFALVMAVACSRTPTLRSWNESLQAYARRHLWRCVAVAAVAAILWGVFVHTQALGGIPHVHGEIAHDFQARIFAAGRLWAPAPPPSWQKGLGFFFCPVREGRWFSIQPFGWPAVLALGTLARTAWLVNPFLVGLSLILLALLARRIGGERLALVTAALALASPFFLIMGGTWLSHPLMLVLTCIAFLCHLSEVRGEGSALSIVGLACALGLGANVRPLTALCLLGPLMADVLIRRLGKGDGKSLALAGMVLFLWGAAWLGYNRALTGSALLAPALVPDPGLRLGFGKLGWFGQARAHTIAAGILNCLTNIYAMATDLFGIPLLSLLLPLAGIVAAWRRLPRLWFFAAGLHCGGYFTFHLPGTCYGGRYYFALLPLFFLCAAMAVEGLAALLRSHGLSFATAIFLALFALGGGLSYYPHRIAMLSHYGQTYPEAYEVLAEKKIRGRVVTVPPNLWPTLFSGNGPFLDGENLYWNVKGGRVPADLLRVKHGGRTAIFPVGLFLHKIHAPHDCKAHHCGTHQ